MTESPTKKFSNVLGSQDSASDHRGAKIGYVIRKEKLEDLALTGTIEDTRSEDVNGSRTYTGWRM